jgi:hypothetical protein
VLRCRGPSTRPALSRAGRPRAGSFRPQSESRRGFSCCTDARPGSHGHGDSESEFKLAGPRREPGPPRRPLSGRVTVTGNLKLGLSWSHSQCQWPGPFGKSLGPDGPGSQQLARAGRHVGGHGNRTCAASHESVSALRSVPGAGDGPAAATAAAQADNLTRRS